MTEGLSAAAWGVGAMVAVVRWLRVAQREHYLPGAATRFAFRWWWGSRPVNRLLMAAVLVMAGLAIAGQQSYAGAGALALAPFGLGLRGRTGRLAWTRRLRTLSAVWFLLSAVVAVGGGLAGTIAGGVAVAGVGAPVILDAALWVTAPVERRLAQRWVRRASQRVAQIKPTVVAITGSYGKTSTKVHLAHLLAGTKTVMATPRSFNNRAGLALSINEHLAPGTEVFVAEMGTYGSGEIAELCSWMVPSVSVITAIGPVHLERFKSEDRIVAAKSEILEPAPTVVLNVDDPRLADLATRSAAEGKAVWRCSGLDQGADVFVGDGRVMVRGDDVSRFSRGDLAVTNVACAIAAALALGVPVSSVVSRLDELPVAEHRLSVETGGGGVQVLDDTFNSNPAGAARALDALRAAAGDRSRATVVTPGMVELGPQQLEHNAAFARAAAGAASRVVVVGQTNHDALIAGARAGGAEVIEVATRPEAAAWVRNHLGPGDVVLYENDLPDIYP